MAMPTPARPRDTPAESIARLAGELADHLLAVRAFFAGSNLAAGLTAIGARAAQPIVDVDVLTEGGDEGSTWTRSAGAERTVREIGGATIRVSTQQILGSQIVAAGTIQAAVLVVTAPVWTASGREHVSRWCADRPLVVCVDRPPELPRALAASAWSVVDLGGGPAALEALLNGGGAPGLCALLAAAAAARALASAVQAIGIEGDAELRTLRCRRAVLAQSAAAFQSSTRMVTVDVVTEVRNAVQKLFADFARGVEERTEDACAAEGPVTLAILRDVDACLALTEVVQQRSIIVKLSPGSEQQALRAVGTRFREHARADITAANDLFEIAAAAAAAILEQRAVPIAAPVFTPFDSTGLDSLIDRLVALQRQFTGSLPKVGLFEYVMIARRYQMMLFMFISAFGLSFLRTYREFMVPSAVLLLSLGAINVWLTVRREHQENRGREQDKARELLRSDVRRLLMDLQRGWTGTVANALTSQLLEYTSQLNAQIADAEGRRATRVHDTRHGLQRQLQGVDQVERRLAALQKAAAASGSAVAQLRGEIRQMLHAALGARR